MNAKSIHRSTELKCFPNETLQDFMLGKVEDEIAALIVQHLDQCEKCEETVVALEDKEDTFVGKIPRQSVADDAGSDIKNVISKIKNSPQHLEEDLADDCLDKIGDYLIHQPLGIGGMGTVFKATHSHLDKVVALKVLPHRKMQNSEAISRFRREMKIVGQLDHPSIVQATDAGQVHGTHYLAMEYVDGLDLGLLIKHSENLSSGSCCELICQAAKGIAYVHSQGVIHRDIKPSNLMLTRQGHVKILDLGLAMLSGVTGIVDELTTVGQLMGTIDYMAPEQYGDSHLIDQRADVYALGATLYKMLTRHAPFDNESNESPLQKLKRIATEAPVPVLERNPDLDPELAQVVNKAIDRDADERYQSADEFAAALEPFCDSVHISDELESAVHSLREYVQHRKENEEANLDDVIVKNPYEESIEKEISLLTEKVEQLESQADSGKNRRFTWWKVALAGFFVFGALFCGILIQIEMDKGRLVIESESDNVKVTLLKDGKVYDKMELEQGTNSTRIRAGKYEVVIDEGSDKLVIDQDQFKLTRGETIVAKIKQEYSSKNEKAADNKSAAKVEKQPGPVYQGLNLAEWLEKTKTDVFRTDKIGDLFTINSAPIRKLAEFGPQNLIDDAAQYWATVIESETSLDQVYRLVPLIDALSNTKENADLLTGKFLGSLFRNFDPEKKALIVLRYVNGVRQPRSITMSGIFDRWGPENQALVEAKLFSNTYDKTENSEEVRMAFLSGKNFNTNSKQFFASHENILNLLKAFNESSLDNRLKMLEWVSKLTIVPEKLSSETKVELKKKLAIVAREAKAPFKEAAIQCLIDLDANDDALLEEIVDHLDQNPELVPMLTQFEDIDHAIARIEKLLKDENWGWTNKFKAQALVRPLPPRNSLAGMMGRSGGMSGAMISSGGGMMSSSMGSGGGSFLGNMSVFDKNKLMGRSDFAELANLRYELVLKIGTLGEKAKSLLPVLRNQQKLTSNQDYLDAVWHTYGRINRDGVPNLFGGKELDVWNAELARAKNDSEFALAMIAIADLIGELDFDDRFNSRSSRASSRSRTRSSIFREIEGKQISNKNEFVRFMQSLLPKLRELNYDDFNSSEENYKSCYKDPRMAAFLLGNGIALDLIRVATKEDYDFLSCLRTIAYDEVESYRYFLNTALKSVEPGSVAQYRFVAKASEAEYKLLVDILLDERSSTGTQLLIMERMLIWNKVDGRATPKFLQLLQKYPDISLSMLSHVNVSLYRRRGNVDGQFGNPRRHGPTNSALLGLHYLIAATGLEVDKDFEVFPDSKIYGTEETITFNESIRSRRSRVERVMDILLLANSDMINSEFVKILEDKSTSLDTSGLIDKLQSLKPKVDQVVQNKIDKFVSALSKAYRNHTVPAESLDKQPKEKQ